MPKTMDLESNSKEQNTKKGHEMDASVDNDQDSVTTGSFIKVGYGESKGSRSIPEDTYEPNYYDINILA